MTVRRGIALGGLVLVLVVAYVVWPRDTTEISREEAVEDFREQTEGQEAEGATGPQPGVYVYAAEGEERVRLGPLPTQTRPFPETVTAVVVDHGDGCFDWQLNLFAEHTEDTRWCVGEDLRLDEHVKHQRIGALSPTATMTCDPDVVAPDAELACRLTLDGGPASVTADLAGEVTGGEPETIIVDGTDVETTPITVTWSLSGDLSGAWTETVWWSDDHLPVRVERDLDLEGLATFHETSRLELTSLDPES